jgi:hypothetical protein
MEALERRVKALELWRAAATGQVVEINGSSSKEAD